MFNHRLKHRIFTTSTLQLVKVLTLSVCLSTLNVYADEAHPDIEAKTTAGENVILHANGKWEFVNQQKATKAKEIAIKLDPSANCPPGSQGSFFGFGRCILPGNKDYQTGSRSGKGFGN